MGRDPVADWKAFPPETIPTKGGESLEKLPAIFLDTLERLENRKSKSSRNDAVVPQKKQLSYSSRYLSILELGCGCGELARALQHRGHSVHGIDCNSGAIEVARTMAAKALSAHQESIRIECDNNKTSNGALHSSEFRSATFEVGNVCSSQNPTFLPPTSNEGNYDFCILQLLLSVVGGHDNRKQVLCNARDSLKQPGGVVYLSCSGVSDDINPKYGELYRKDALELKDEHGDHSYYSRNDETTILYVTHHFTVSELESLLSEAGFGEIVIERRKETSSRRPSEQAYFLFATAVVAATNEGKSLLC